MKDFTLTKSIPSPALHSIMTPTLIFTSSTTLHFQETIISYPHPIIGLSSTSQYPANPLFKDNNENKECARNVEFTHGDESKIHNKDKKIPRKCSSIFVLTTNRLYQYATDVLSQPVLEVTSLAITRPVYSVYSTQTHVIICYSNIIDVYEVPSFYRSVIYKRVQRIFCTSVPIYVSFYTDFERKDDGSYKNNVIQEYITVVFRDNTVKIYNIHDTTSFFVGTFLSCVISAYMTTKQIIIVTTESIIYYNYSKTNKNSDKKENHMDDEDIFAADLFKKVIVKGIISSSYSYETETLFIAHSSDQEEDIESVFDISLYKNSDFNEKLPIKFKNIIKIECDHKNILVHTPDFLKIYNYVKDTIEEVVYTPNILCYNISGNDIVVGGNDSIQFYKVNECINLKASVYNQNLDKYSKVTTDIETINHKILEHEASNKPMNNEITSLNNYPQPEKYIPLLSKTQILFLHISKNLFLSISSLGTASLSNRRNNVKIKTFDIPFHITSTATTEELDLLCIGTGTGNVFVYDVKRGKCIDTLLGSTNGVHPSEETGIIESSCGPIIKIIARGDSIYTLSLDNVIRKIHLYSKKREIIETNSTNVISDFCVGKYFCILKGNEVLIYDMSHELVKSIGIKEKSRNYLTEKMSIMDDNLLFIYAREKKKGNEMRNQENKIFYYNKTNIYSDKKGQNIWEEDKEFNHYVLIYHIKHNIKVQEIRCRKINKMSVSGKSLILHSENGFFIYTQKGIGFQPIDLDVGTTPESVFGYIKKNMFLHALIAAIKLDNNNINYFREEAKLNNENKNAQDEESNINTNNNFSKEQENEKNIRFPLINRVIKAIPNKKISIIVRSLPSKYIPKLREAIQLSDNIDLKWIESVILFHTGIGNQFSVRDDRNDGKMNFFLLEAIKRNQKIE